MYMNGSEKNCYILLLSSGLDSTAAFLNLINTKNLKDDILFPVYIWWKSINTRVVRKEFENCLEIVKYIKEKYKEKELNIKDLTKIEIPFIYFEQIKIEYSKRNNEGYWPYFRNAIFLLSSLSYVLNHLKLLEIKDIKKIIIVTGFIGTEADENNMFIENFKKMINEPLKNEITKKQSRLIEIIREIEFYCPFLSNDSLSKINCQYKDIEEFGDGNILQYVWSCWKDDIKPCNECGGCITRNEKYKIYKSQGGTLEDPFYYDAI